MPENRLSADAKSAGADQDMVRALSGAADVTQNAAVAAINSYAVGGGALPITLQKLQDHLNSPASVDPLDDIVVPVTKVGDETPVGNADPFDLANIAVAETSLEDLGVDRPILAIPVEKPGKQDFFRVNPDPGFSADVRIIDLEADREKYLVTRAVWPSIPGETKLARLVPYLTRTGSIGLWPLNIPDEMLGKRDTNWGTTARKAAELAETKWVRLQANMSRGMYDVVTSDRIPDPVWPNITFKEILKIAFGDGHLIDSLDHPVIRQLDGRP